MVITCKKCGIEQEENCFVKVKKTNYIYPGCKNCRNKQLRDRYNLDKEYRDKVKLSEYRYRHKDIDKTRIKKRLSYKKWRVNNLEKVREMEKVKYYKNIDKNRARMKLNYYVYKNKIIKPDNCSNCGVKSRLQAHHFLGYKKENWLKVIWLCAPCHKIADKIKARGFTE